MNYEVIYTIELLNMPIITYVTLVLSIGMIALLVATRKSPDKKSFRRNMIIASVITGLFGSIGLLSHFRNLYALKNGNYKIAEGKIESFSPALQSPKGIETLIVNGIEFRYSNAILKGGLSHSISDNEYIKNRAYIRVYYKGDTILRIEGRK